jgi:Fe-S-cluster containining protein
MSTAKKERYPLDWVTDSLAVGRAPMSHEDLESIRRQGIKGILNLCAEFCDLHWIEADAGFEVHFFPIPDEEAPNLPELEKALSWLDECLYLGKKVLVHCRFGIGRTGTLVNAYLLRRGLGHKMAEKRLKGFKSKPTNFCQWWFLRKYRKLEKPLTIREPSLESKHLVDLFPFFANYESLLQALNERLVQVGTDSQCGMGHDRCCHEPVVVTLIEAVHLSYHMNIGLARQDREAVIQRAVENLRPLRELQQSGKITAKVDIPCPLNESHRCRVFAARPVACRLFDLPAKERIELSDDLQKALTTLSQQVWFAYASTFPEDGPLTFFLSEVVSGKFVQSFFHRLMKGG